MSTQNKYNSPFYFLICKSLTGKLINNFKNTATTLAAKQLL